MKKKILSLFILFVFAAFSLVGCDLTKPKTEEQPAEQEPTEISGSLTISDLETLCNKSLEFIDAEHPNYEISATEDIEYSTISTYFNEYASLSGSAITNVSYSESAEEVSVDSSMFDAFVDTRETLPDGMAHTALSTFLYGDIMQNVVNDLDMFITYGINQYPECTGENPYVVYSNEQIIGKLHIVANNGVILFKMTSYQNEVPCQIIFLSIIYDSDLNYKQVILASEINPTTFSRDFDANAELAFIFRVYDVESNTTYVLKDNSTNATILNAIKGELESFAQTSSNVDSN